MSTNNSQDMTNEEDMLERQNDVFFSANNSDDDEPHDNDDNGDNDDEDVQLDFTMGAPPEVDHDSNTPFISAEVPIIDIDISDELIRSSQIIADRARYIPLRLSLKERKKLRLVEASLNVSDYTDKVDIYSHQSKSKRIHHQLIEICSVLCGLVVASDYREGQRLIVEREFKDNEVFFQRMWETGRRYKVSNPDKMRTDYGKLMFLLMDSCIPEIESTLEFRMVTPIRTVYSYLEECGATAMLSDERMEIATRAIYADGVKTRRDIRGEVEAKEKAVRQLSRKFSSDRVDEEDLRMCLYSIGDNNSYLLSNRVPIDKMLHWLRTGFEPDRWDDDESLAIIGGCDGARLSHSHATQYTYVLQTLILWREITNDMFRLWYLADLDVLDSQNRYSLRDTGQGLNRIQGAPRVGQAMHRLISQVQQSCGQWIGSSVVHLGDRNVPNSLVFIDKYTQIERILAPIIRVIEFIPVLCKEDPGIADYIERSFGGKARLRKIILLDFFRHAFDGSGANNFFDAGSCIDGRLTSAWNWCSKLEKKPYYSVFKLCGFHGFDGDFGK